MAKIYKSTDKIKLKLGELQISVSPLTFYQKSEIQLILQEAASKKDPMGLMKAAFVCVKYAVKEIHGVETADGSQYELEFDGDVLSDECVNDLFSLEESEKLSLVCINLLQSRYSKFIDPNTQEILKGVEIIEKSKPEKKK